MSEKITFKELVELIAEQSEQSQNATNSFIGELVQIIELGLKKSGSVSLSGFGKFELRWMNERDGVNPQTREEITIPGQNKIVFKPYKNLREELNRPYAKLKTKILAHTPVKKENEEHVVDDVQIKVTEKPKDERGTGKLIIPVPKLTFPPKQEKKEEDKGVVKDKEREKEKEKEKDEQKIDDGEHLLIERPVPVKEPKESPDDEDLLYEDLFKEKRPESSAIPIKKEEKKRSPLKKKEPKSLGIIWSYAAVAVILVIAIFIIFLMMQRTDVPVEVATTQNEQMVTPETPAVPDPGPETEEVVTEEPAAVPQPDDTFPFALQPHAVRAGESHWTIAGTQMGDPFLWPVIYELNREQYNNPDFIRAQDNLTIPSDADPDQLSEPQLEQVALGYLSVYRWTAENSPENAKYFLWAVGVYSIDILYSVENEVDTNDWEFALRR